MNRSTGIALIVLVIIAGAGYLVFHNQPAADTAEDDTLSRTVESDNNNIADVILRTSMGDIAIDLFDEKTPKTAQNFRTLAAEGFYDGIKFHRVIPNFMIQTGDPLTKDDTLIAQWGRGGPGYTIADEFVEGLSNVRGTIAMANTGQPNSGGSQFFINVADNTGLDFDKDPLTSKHPVFGEVVSGMDVVDAIVATPTEGPDRPITPVVIEKVILNN